MTRPCSFHPAVSGGRADDTPNRALASAPALRITVGIEAEFSTPAWRELPLS